MEGFKFALKKPSSLGQTGEDPKEDANDTSNNPEGSEDQSSDAADAGLAFAAALKGSDGEAIAETYRRLRDSTV